MTPLSDHARKRAKNRSIPENAVETCLSWGRQVRQVGNDEVHFIGRKEIEAAKKQDVDLSDYDGLAVVTSKDGVVITIMWADSPRKLQAPRHSHHARSAASGAKKLKRGLDDVA